MSKHALVAVVLLGCGVEPSDPAATVHPKAPDVLLAAFSDEAPHSFIVALTPVATDRRTQLGRIMQLDGIALDRDWDQLPLAQVRASSLDAALATLDSDDVEQAFEVRSYELSDAESFPLIHQPAAIAAGMTGAGTAVAILDTGTNYTRSDFGSCTAPGVPAGCRVAYAADFAANDGSLDDNGHGTNVAGIVAGLATGTKILALDVFSGGTASSTDIISALNWVLANRATYNIASLNLSLGGGSSTVQCTNDAVGNALASARSAGIAPVVASGNSALTNALTWPACAPAAISVGAVYDANVGGLQYSNCLDSTTVADKITCFSDSANFLTLLAPGALITAGGYTMAGTSQATPHVAGAFAVLHAAFPTNTVDQELARLVTTGKPITDPRNNITKPRIDIGAASVGAADVTPPTGTVALASGGTVTRTTAITLALTASDPSGVAQMCITNSTTCTTFEAFAAQKAWTLPAGDGVITVMVMLRDTKGNTTTATTSPKLAVRLDTTAPTNGTLTTTAGASSVALSWSGVTDAGSGVASYRLAVATGTTPPATCATAMYAGTALTTTHTGLASGTTDSYRLCALDAAGNSSAGATATATPHELDPPVGSIKLAGGATTTRTLAVAVTVAATDASGVTQMCIADATACTAWVTYATAATYTFVGDGSHTLRAWFRDKWGNTSTPATATILVDTIAPTGATLSSTSATASISLAWTAATDAGSGVASYKLVGTSGTVAPATCSAGTVLYTGTARTYTHAVTARATWSYRVCATDVAGNVSAGSTKTATAL